MSKLFRRFSGPGDRGASIVEFAGILVPALIVILISYQVYVSSTTVERVQNAARTGAREASQRYDPSACPFYAETVIPKSWLKEYSINGGATSVGGDDSVYCTVRAKLPLLFKGLPVDYTVTRTVTMPLG
jgi:Flp pilus assembly protein TadG